MSGTSFYVLPKKVHFRFREPNDARMSESKQTAAAADDERRLQTLPRVDVTAVDISPNPAALADELNLEVDFTLDKPVADGVWDIEASGF